MIADWVAVSVRARGLLRRRLGRAGARRLARAASLADGLAQLARTPYGRDLRTGMDVRAAQNAIAATLIWHLRILAGWAPRQGTGRVRVLAAGFEIANVTRRLAQLAGSPADPPYALGALANASPAIALAPTAEAIRHELAVTAWGDPGTTDPAGIRTALEAAWARRVVDAVPEAAGWGAAYAALLVARAAAETPLSAHGRAAQCLRSVLGSRWEGATLGELPDRLPASLAWVLDGVHGRADLWRAEARWWSRVESDAFRLQTASRPSPASVVGVVALLATDAWRTRAALEFAARGGAQAELFDAVA